LAFCVSPRPPVYTPRSVLGPFFNGDPSPLVTGLVSHVSSLSGDSPASTIPPCPAPLWLPIQPLRRSSVEFQHTKCCLACCHGPFFFLSFLHSAFWYVVCSPSFPCFIGIPLFEAPLLFCLHPGLVPLFSKKRFYLIGLLVPSPVNLLILPFFPVPRAPFQDRSLPPTRY